VKAVEPTNSGLAAIKTMAEIIKDLLAKGAALPPLDDAVGLTCVGSCPGITAGAGVSASAGHTFAQDSVEAAPNGETQYARLLA